MVIARDAESWSKATPARVVDLPVVDRNVACLAESARQHRRAIRPHAKTHKSVRMARLQLASGAVTVDVLVDIDIDFQRTDSGEPMTVDTRGRLS